MTTTMTSRQVAERLREITGKTSPHPYTVMDALTEITSLADELYPPRPEPDMAVWWRSPYMPGWEIAKVHQTDNQLMGIYNLHGDFMPIDNVQWKPAHILGPGQVAVKVPPVGEWPENTGAVNIWAQYTDGMRGDVLKRITRVEAEAMEAER